MLGEQSPNLDPKQGIGATNAHGETQLPKYSIPVINSLIARFDFFFFVDLNFFLLIFNTEKLEGLYLLLGFDLY